ncbi:hypothetical protein HYH03_015931 [Edaphochlamys debaryana]|uniref:ABC transporter n=1 Tax=Edaphochlamys debaryana TaxID=47281 RepID=A0A836BQP4_9CHLO|nr:hypothetical protein HYH03_015931 [Edaphochlamys debaryana]|eukprot:KAG2485350.1 hypothetical protein HYH03_015931 [Edaphochlamys debaryana]
MSLQFTSVVADFIRDNPGIALLNFTVGLVITPVADTLLPHLYGRLISTVEKHGAYLTPLLLLLGGMVFVHVGNIVKEYVDAEMQPMLFDYVKTRMMQAILEKYDGNMIEPNTGQIVSKVVRSPDIIAWWTSAGIEYFIPQALSFLVTLSYFLAYDRVLALSLVFMVIATVVLLVWSPSQCIKPSVQREQLLDQVHEEIDDVMRNLISVYSNDTTQAELDKLHASGASFKKSNRAAMLCLLKYKCIGIPALLAFICFVIIRCCYLIKEGRLKTGNFVSIFMMTTTTVGTLLWLVSIIKGSTLDLGTIMDAQTVFSSDSSSSNNSKSPSKSPVPEHPSELRPPQSTGIGLSHVTYAHAGSKEAVLQDVTVHFEAGQCTVITGHIGSGKSTILKLLLAFIKPQSGDLYVSDHWYGDVLPRDVRKQVAFMPQEATLFNRSIIDNILYGNPSRTIQDVHDMIERLGVWKEFKNMTDGLHTNVGKNGSRLSGGQRQLVWFLRIMLRDPAYIILDEPTSSMDYSTRSVLIHALKLVTQEGRTVVMVTHDDELLELATRRVVIV